ncbi:TPA: SDR family NAD(P)-dependent oxidoreductase, partial [Klebsiella pneumoniae]
MIIDLSGKTAIVTGSTGGIGLAIARGLSAAGAGVVLCGRQQSRLDAALAQLSGTRGAAHARGVLADPATAAGCQALIAAVPQADILINNLGIYAARDFFDIS